MADPKASEEMEVEELNRKTVERDTEIEKLLVLVDIIVAKLGKTMKDKISSMMLTGQIDLSDEISGFLMIVYTCLRKEENDPAGHLKYKAYSNKIAGVEIGVQSIVEAVKDRKLEINFLVATPIVELMTLCKGFFDEVRSGVTRFKVRTSVARKSLKRDSTGKPVAWGKDTKDLT